MVLAFSWTIEAQAQNAKKILDQTAQTISKNGAVKASFVLKNFIGQKQSGESATGNILLNGKKFKLNAQGVTTWFDGKTEWTYVAANEEVNITEPTDEELQTINPYNFLNFYKTGYTHKMGKTKKFQGKDAYEVQCIAKSNKMDIKQVVLYVDKNTSQLLQIQFRQGTNNWVSITVTDFKGNQKVDNNSFTFNTKDAPNAEIIDLR